MSVYIEWVVLNNFGLGFLLIYLSAHISGVRVCPRRLLLGAAVNGVAAAFIFAAGNGALGLILRVVTVGAVYFASAFSRVWTKRTLNFLGAFFVVNLLFAGCFFLLISITGGAYILNGGVVATGAAAGLVVPGLVVGTAAAGIVRREVCRSRLTDRVVRLKITSGATVEADALLDTGNRVQTLTGLPALILDPALYDSLDSEKRPCTAGCVTVTGKTTLTGFVPTSITAVVMGREKAISAAVFRSEAPINGEYKGVLNPRAVIYF